MFKGKPGKLLGNFIFQYKNVLFELYKYQILLKHITEEEASKKSNKYKELQKKYDEQKYRKSLLESISLLKESYTRIEKNKVIDKVEKMIQL